MTAPGTADDPEELAALICQARTQYLQAQKALVDIGKIENWRRSNGFTPGPGIAAMRADLEQQLDTLVPSIREAEAGLSATVPAATAEDLLAKARTAEQEHDTETDNDPFHAIAMLSAILTGPDSLEAKRALVAKAFGGETTPGG